MHVVIAGASGFLGSSLTTHLRQSGHEVTALVRRPATAPDESEWRPTEGVVDHRLIGAADVVVNLAGSPTVGNPHSGRWARRLRESRVRTTQVLATAIAETGGRAGLLAGNGISYYGDHGAEVVTERSDSRGEALLTTVTHEWQAATRPAAEAGARVCILRTAPVMDRRHPPLSQLAALFRFGLGASLGAGRHYFPMVSLRDWVGATAHLAGHATASGPFNLCCPETPTNKEFTDALAAAVGRRAVLRAPSPVLRVAAGELAPELLNSINARPEALLASGYSFRDPDVGAVLASGLG